MFQCGPFEARNGEGKRLYSNVDVHLEEGELTLLEGASGSGKSTLLRQMAGLGPAVGEIQRILNGRTWDTKSMAAWRSRVNLLMQDAPVIPGTLSDNLEFPFRLKAARDRALDWDRAHWLLGEVDLDRIALERSVQTLSGGERHRLAIVRSILWDAPVLLADEPLAGLDEQRSRRCMGLLGEFARREGHAVLCVLHDQSLASAADRRLALTGEGLAAR